LVVTNSRHFRASFASLRIDGRGRPRTSAPVGIEPAQAAPPKREFGQRQPDVGGRGLTSAKSNVRDLLRTVTRTRKPANDETVRRAANVNRVSPADARREGDETPATNHRQIDQNQSPVQGLRNAVRRAIGWDVAGDIESSKSETDHSDKSDD
jgi:hypothetical protein